MTEKMSTVIVKVDLSCCRCNKKIRKVLDKYKDRWDIKTIEYDEKNCSVKLCGSFVPEKLIERLCKKACKIILDITIECPKPEPPKSEPPKPKPCKCKPPKPKPPKCEPPKPTPPKCEPPKPEPPKPCPPKPPCSYPYPYPYPLPICYPPKCEPPKCKPPEPEPPKPEPSKCKPPKPCPPEPPCAHPCPLPSCCPQYCGPCPENPRPPTWCVCDHGPPCGFNGWCERPGYGRPACRLVYEEEGSNCSIM